VTERLGQNGVENYQKSSLFETSTCEAQRVNKIINFYLMMKAVARNNKIKCIRTNICIDGS
jgi:hypothetical protein